jgi:acyl carrier protein
MPDGSSVANRVKRTVVSALKLEIEADQIGDDEILFEAGLGVDSVAMMELIVALEKEFSVAFSDDLIRIELFASVNSIVMLLAPLLEDTETERASLGSH